MPFNEYTVAKPFKGCERLIETILCGQGRVPHVTPPAEMPLSDVRSRIARSMKLTRYRGCRDRQKIWHLSLHIASVVSQLSVHSQSSWYHSSCERGTGRRTDWRTCIKLGEARTLRCNSIDVWRLQITVSECGQVAVTK